MIPPLQANGTLPPGIHSATIDEVFVAFPAINEQRKILNESLQCAVDELRQFDQTLTIYIDGSYITSKLEPNDVDLLIITAQHDTQTILAYLDQVCPVEAVSLGVYVEPQAPNFMLNFFTTTRAGQAKGIIELQ